MIVLAILAVVIAALYVLIFSVAITAHRADERLKEMWEERP